MVRIDIVGDQVIFRVLGWHVLWACRRTVTVPRHSIVSVQPARAAGVLRPQGIRCLGTYIPGIIAAGSYLKRGGSSFWDVRHLDQALVFTLQDAAFARVVVEVTDPAAVQRQFTV